jgi:hypothetical protein
LHAKVEPQFFTGQGLKPFEQSLNIVASHHGNPDNEAGVSHALQTLAHHDKSSFVVALVFVRGVD